MEINNENETYTLHFMFSYRYSMYQIFMDICNETISKEHIKQVMGRQQITQNIIHENSSRKIYLSIYIYIYDYLIE